MKHTISWENQGAFVSFEGTITGEGLLAYQNELLKNERYDELRHVIVDYRQARITHNANDEQEVPLAISIGASHTLKALKLAIVATEGEMVQNAEYRIGKLKEYGVNWEMAIFPTPAEARKWVETTGYWR